MVLAAHHTRRLLVVFYTASGTELQAHSTLRATKGRESFEPFILLRDIPDDCATVKLCLVSHPDNTNKSPVFVDGLSATPVPRSHVYARRLDKSTGKERPDGSIAWPFRSIGEAIKRINELPKEDTAALFLYPGVYSTAADRGLTVERLRFAAFGLSGQVDVFRYALARVFRVSLVASSPAFFIVCVWTVGAGRSSQVTVPTGPFAPPASAVVPASSQKASQNLRRVSCAQKRDRQEQRRGPGNLQDGARRCGLPAFRPLYVDPDWVGCFGQ